MVWSTAVVDWALLRARAVEAASFAHCPYSGLQVGAAALCDDGRIVVGCNVENGSYGVTLCAECGLVSNLHASGGGRLVGLLCVNVREEVITPCGRCRQVLLEHGGPLCQREIAARLCVSEPVVSRTVRALLRLGLVQREIPIKDERYRVVSVTAHGRKAFLETHDEDDDPSLYWRTDVQTDGETMILQDFARTLDRAGLRFLAQIAELTPPDGVVDYDSLRMCLLDGPYRNPDEWGERVERDVPIPGRPPLEGGLMPDPLSVEWLARTPPKRPMYFAPVRLARRVAR